MENTAGLAGHQAGPNGCKRSRCGPFDILGWSKEATPLIQQGFAYLAMRGCRLATLDLQDWRKPRLVDELRCGGPVRWLQADPRISGQVLTDGSIVDITDPEQPRRIGWWPARAVPDGDRLYLLQQDSMSVSRWSPSGPGSELGRFPTGGAPVALDVYGGFAYIAHTVEGYLSNDEDRSGVRCKPHLNGYKSSTLLRPLPCAKSGGLPALVQRCPSYSGVAPAAFARATPVGVAGGHGHTARGESVL